MKTVKRIAALFALMFTAAAWAVDDPTPVALWNGDFKETTKGSYTLSDNGNTVAADGSTITIATTATNGVLVDINPALTTGKTTLIVKYSGLSTPGSNAVLLSGAMNGQIKDLVGVAVKTDGSISNIWDNNADSRGSVDSAVAVPQAGIVAFTYDGNNSTASNKGGAFYVKTDSGMARKSQSLGSLFSTGNPVNGFAIGGKRASGSLGVLPGLVIEGVAIFDSVLSTTDMAAYEFPQKESSSTPVLLINIGTTTAVDGWLAHNQTEGEWIPTKTTKLSQGDATFQVSKSTFGGNFSSAEGFGSPVTTTFESGSYRDVFGNDHDSIFEEIKTSLGLAADISESIYTTGVINGGQSSHIGTIGGLDASAKYIVYVGQGYKKKDGNDTHSFKIDTDGYATVEGLDYAVTVNGTGTAKNAQYTSFDAGTTLQPGVNGLLIVRMKGIVPKEDGTIAFSMPAGRSGLNFLAVAKMNEVEEQEEEETETKNYSFGKYLTTTYQDTEWDTTLADIKAYGAITGTMAGGYMDNRPTPSTGVRFADAKDGSEDVLEFQMQTKNDVHLKAVKVYLKESASGIQIRAVGAGVILNGGTVGDNITSWGNELSTTLNGNGYSVASVALAITKPVDKSVKGTIGEVETAHSEDYTSNTITAKVTIENEGEYKGEAVLVYMLGDTQYSGEINADGSASITVEDLEREKVYRGTLALGQKIGDEVTIIEGTELPVALYQGERKYTWMASPIVIKKATTINSGEGCTAPVPTDMPDYVENCDSVFTVSISAAEAVSEENDTESLEGVQGGVRIAEVGGALKLQVVKNGVWTVFSNAEIDKTYAMTVTFHYAKDENDTDPAVSYVLDKTTETSAKMTDKTKVTEVFIADGTVLPDDLTGLFQFDSAVVVDIELKPGEGDLVEYSSKEAAEAALGNLKIGICDAVKSVLKTEEQQSTYRSYFYLAVVPSAIAKDGFAVKTELKSDITTEIEKDIAEAMARVVEGFNTGSAEIAAKPGLYYGVKRGDSLDAMNTVETEMATSEKVTITITKPDNAKQHFYRIIVSPTPASNK